MASRRGTVYHEKQKYSSTNASLGQAIQLLLFCVAFFALGWWTRDGMTNPPDQPRNSMRSSSPTSTLQSLTDSPSISLKDSTDNSFSSGSSGGSSSGSNSISSSSSSSSSSSGRSDGGGGGSSSISNIPSVLDDELRIILPAFENILRSCLGSYCFDERPKGSEKDRIGVLSPPGTGAEILSEILISLMRTEHPKVKERW